VSVTCNSRCGPKSVALFIMTECATVDERRGRLMECTHQVCFLKACVGNEKIAKDIRVFRLKELKSQNFPEPIHSPRHEMPQIYVNKQECLIQCRRCQYSNASISGTVAALRESQISAKKI